MNQKDFKTKVRCRYSCHILDHTGSCFAGYGMCSGNSSNRSGISVYF